MSSYPPPSTPPTRNPDSRPLPEGWVTQFDETYKAWFYVDTRVDPVRITWEHPLDPPGAGGPPPPPAYDSRPSGSPGGPVGFPEANRSSSPYAPQGSGPAPPGAPGGPGGPQGSGERGIGSFVAGAAVGGLAGNFLGRRHNKHEHQQQQQQQGGGYYPSPPPQGYYSPPPQGYYPPPQGYYPPPQGYGYASPPPQQVVVVREEQQRRGGGGFGAGGLALAAGGGLLGGMLLENAIDNDEERAYDQGFDDGSGFNDDMGGDW